MNIGWKACCSLLRPTGLSAYHAGSECLNRATSTTYTIAERKHSFELANRCKSHECRSTVIGVSDNTWGLRDSWRREDVCIRRAWFRNLPSDVQLEAVLDWIRMRECKDGYDAAVASTYVQAQSESLPKCGAESAEVALCDDMKTHRTARSHRTTEGSEIDGQHVLSTIYLGTEEFSGSERRSKRCLCMHDTLKSSHTAWPVLIRYMWEDHDRCHYGITTKCD
jgi:hypothetical protein